MMDGTWESSARFVGCDIALARNSVYPGHYLNPSVQEDNFSPSLDLFRDKNPRMIPKCSYDKATVIKYYVYDRNRYTSTGFLS